MAEWLKAAVLKTAGRKPRGFESLPLRHGLDALRFAVDPNRDRQIGPRWLPRLLVALAVLWIAAVVITFAAFGGPRTLIAMISIPVTGLALGVGLIAEWRDRREHRATR